MSRHPYYPGAEVWKHPRADQTLVNVNRMRAVVYGAPPLVREKASTEDVIRERLKDGDKWDREVRRLARRRGGTLEA
jgi:hypothetical protein